MLANLTSTISLFASEGGSTENFADLHVEPWVWAAFLSFVAILLVADLLLVHKTAHVISTKEAAIESADLDHDRRLVHVRRLGRVGRPGGR